VTTAGYSGTPLAKKLGFKPGMRVFVAGAPKDYASWLANLPPGATVVKKSTPPLQAAHVFVTRRTELATSLGTLRAQLAPDGFVWVSWPKKASGVRTEITEDTIRELALPLDFVDVKVCAVSDVWSGLRLMIRREAR
jgi:hypothetical protein